MLGKLLNQSLRTFSKKSFSTLVIAEHKNNKLASSATNILRAAKELNQEVYIFKKFLNNLINLDPCACCRK